MVPPLFIHDRESLRTKKSIRQHYNGCNHCRLLVELWPTTLQDDFPLLIIEYLLSPVSGSLIPLKQQKFFSTRFISFVFNLYVV
ncbi:hypothetical protein [Liquorilactobacillus oeni]|uniref:hypothetical protein n=1 Tax=Liquorilactobacillus oeni TaxID=303241 RepID=UPI0012EE0027|nr:hypothetical protein [Liquorilactobacillus oeni]